MDEQTLLPYKTDIAVLILFFNRPECLEKVFEAVREARPSRLFLYQDGPRGGRICPVLWPAARLLNE